MPDPASPIRLNLGGGDKPLPGYITIDAKSGGSVYPLPHESGSVDAIYASHVLEHFSYSQTSDVLREWVRVLRPGGDIRIAVPDFAAICKMYAEHHPMTESVTVGGQTDALDVHRALFDRGKLSALMRDCGLIGIREWAPIIDDCAALPVSLNLMGTKPGPALLRPECAKRVAAVMSMPRLAVTANFRAVHSALTAAGVSLTVTKGVFWEQCLERAISEELERGKPDYILTIDYDSVFALDHLYRLITIMDLHPGCDALAPLQVKRGGEAKALFWSRSPIDAERFAEDVTYVDDAHFGLTLLRADRFRALPRPWFCSRPDSDGRWGDGRIDADIHFWRRWRERGYTVGVASHVSIGHLEEMILWPSDAEPRGVLTQTMADYDAHGEPSAVRR